MSRIVLAFSVSVLALSSLVIAVSIALPSVGAISRQAKPTGRDFDAVFADAASVPVAAFRDADREKIRTMGLARLSASADR